MTPRFFNDLRYDEHDDGVTITVTQPLHYFSVLLEKWTGDGHIYVEAGFVCDMTSLRLFGLHSRGPWNRAAVVHDKLFKQPWFKCPKTGVAKRLSKHQCDLIFREAMICLHTHPVRVELYYTGVLLFGYRAWWGHRINDWKLTCVLKRKWTSKTNPKAASNS